MADNVRYDTTTINGWGRYVSKGRRSLINPGDRKTPTDYYSHSLTQSHLLGLKMSQRVIQGKAYQTSADSFTAADAGQGLTTVSQFLNWPGYTYDPAVSSLYGEADRIAISNLLSRVQAAKGSDFNAAVFAAEAGRSLQMIVSAATRTSQAVIALRKGRLDLAYRALGRPLPSGRLPEPKRVRENLADYWLEASYGWRPLLSDAKSAAEKVAQLVIDKVPVCKVTARGNASSVRVQHVTSVLPNYTVAETEGVGVEICLEYRFSNPAIAHASSLGLTNPFLVAWEVVPFSFVIDWFLPIGGFLEALSAYHGLEFVSGRKTARRNGGYSVETKPYRTSYGFTDGIEQFDTFSGSSYKKNSFGWTRGRLYSFPRPRFPAPRAPFGGTTALQRAASAVSLILQRNPFAQSPLGGRKVP